MPSTDESSKEMALAILKQLQVLEFAKSSKALEKEILKRFSLKSLPLVLSEKRLALQPIKKANGGDQDDDASSTSSDSSESSSSSSSDEESEAEVKKSKGANEKPSNTKNKKKSEAVASSDSSSDSGSDSDSDSGSDSDSDSDSSSSESDEDEPPKKKAKTTLGSKSKKETEVVTPEESSDSDSDSDSDVSDVEVSSVSSVSSDDDSNSDSDSDSDSDSSSSDSSSDSESEDEDIEAIQKARRKKAAEKAKQAAEAALAWTPKKIKKDDVKIEAGTDGAQALSAGKPFQRVDDSFWGEKAIKDGGAMADNSYEGVFGGDGFGAKSSEKLLQVRGKRFQHEKTKRKRSFNGLARTGGKIDMASNSTKYKYDE
eukprot:CAMPEP_0172402094 /NCGR_PEP_ID=MMETSP1061-20121228/53283_1 /TAXON_ID=37318 /ORGANISM="Pseudo-nitzschia pungens, Strain cf. pungens" /LENGTH=370 /DNA_ID=CAMNT_0013135965 /DNA_START=44 /DNA_END=1156 /DNA_ORIENTATION=+